jgi:hypothetical protein
LPLPIIRSPKPRPTSPAAGGASARAGGTQEGWRDCGWAMRRTGAGRPGGRRQRARRHSSRGRGHAPPLVGGGCGRRDGAAAGFCNGRLGAARKAAGHLVRCASREEPTGHCRVGRARSPPQKAGGGAEAGPRRFCIPALSDSRVTDFSILAALLGRRQGFQVPRWPTPTVAPGDQCYM